MTTLLLGLTTTWGSDWRTKVKEIDEFKIEEIALFVTALAQPERQELYKLLEKSGLKVIHHTHLREQDMGKDELDYLNQRWGCQLFNLHPTPGSMQSIARMPEYKDRIYIENTGRDMPKEIEQMINQSAGICLDVSHYKDYGLLQNLENYDHFADLLAKYPIGCAHVSAVADKPRTLAGQVDDLIDYNRHTFRSLDQFDYLKDFVQYLPKYTSIEVENSFEEQIKAKAYIEEFFVVR